MLIGPAMVRLLTQRYAVTEDRLHNWVIKAEQPPEWVIEHMNRHEAKMTLVKGGAQ